MITEEPYRNVGLFYWGFFATRAKSPGNCETLRLNVFAATKTPTFVVWRGSIYIFHFADKPARIAIFTLV
jgi:hypothetical protein